MWTTHHRRWTTHRRRLLAPWLACACLLVCGAASGQTALALQIRSLAATCANCHGTDGRAVEGSAIPSLAGLPRDYIAQQMRAFQTDSRPATVMAQIAKGFSADQVNALAAYFAAQK